MPHPTGDTVRQRRLVHVNDETVTHVESRDFPGHYAGEDNSWNLEEFRNNLKVEFIRNDSHDAVFSLIGVDPSIANAFRRILLSDIPTLAIENVFVDNNTSVIQDEVLAHRIGLIPLKGSKEGLRWLRWKDKPTDEGAEPAMSYDYDTVPLKLEVECKWKPEGQRLLREGVTDPLKIYDNAHIYASHFTYSPPSNGQQHIYFSQEKGPISPVYPDILLAKLRPGQKIKLECHAQLGIGADHAKYSPVATASYRLLPVIDIKRPILGEDAVKFQECFQKGVIGLEEVTAQEAAQQGSGYEGHEGEQKAVVKDAKRDTVTRECLRHDEFKDKVKLGRQRDHFIYSIESTGQFDSDELFVESIKLLKKKCLRIQSDFAKVRMQG